MGEMTRVSTGVGAPEDGRALRSRIVFEKRAGKMVKGEVLHLLFGSQMILGRDESCDVQVQDDRISRKHAMIRLDGSVVRMVDLGSTNGSFRNDDPVTDEIILVNGDRISLAQTINFEVRITERNNKATSVRLATGANAFLLAENEVVIGLATRPDNHDCDLMIYDAAILPQHARLEHFYGNTFIVSYEPDHLVVVNGKPVKELEIPSGSTIEIGQTLMRWEILG